MLLPRFEMQMPQSPNLETTLWVTRSRRPRKHTAVKQPVTDPPDFTEEAGLDAPSESSADPAAPSRQQTRRTRIIVPLFLTVAIACFTLAVLAGAVLHYLFVQYLLSWTDFFLLAGAAITFGHLGGRVLTALSERLRSESR